MTLPPTIRAVARALPTYAYDQATVGAALTEHYERNGANTTLLRRFTRSTSVARRHFAAPIEAYFTLKTFADANEVWLRVGLDLVEEAARRALEKAALRPADVDHVIFVSTTGIATPSLDARLANRIGLPTHVVRTPVFGLGCAGGAAGIARAADVLRAYPDRTVLLVALELCSLTWQRDDTSVANLVAISLFGDACAAAVLSGGDVREAPAGPRVEASRSVFFPETEHIMGWDVRASGLGVMLTTDVPGIARERIPRHVHAFLADHGLGPEDIARWIFHSGGPKVLDAFEAGLHLPAGALDVSRRSLSTVGNVSSVSVLLALEDHLAEAPPAGDAHAALLALGPGFSAEISLLRW